MCWENIKCIVYCVYFKNIVYVYCFCGVFALHAVGGAIVLRITNAVDVEEDERALRVVCPFRLSVLLCPSWRPTIRHRQCA